MPDNNIVNETTSTEFAWPFGVTAPYQLIVFVDPAICTAVGSRAVLPCTIYSSILVMNPDASPRFVKLAVKLALGDV